jgi:outer membrane lipoprotein-sorting protein
MKRSFDRGLFLGAAALCAAAWSAPAQADAAGDKVLASVDAAMNRAQTHYFNYEVTNQEPGKGEKKMELEVRLKGEKRLTEFLAPGDMKGTKVLVLSATQMYVFLPAFGKVRRITNSVTDQGFLGLAFSQDDLATQSYSPGYTAQITAETPAEYTVVATPKGGQTPPYPKIEMKVAKDRMLPTELKYFNAAGTHMKTETRTGYTCEGNICTPGELKMVDHTKGGLWTKMTRKKWKVNEPMSDDLFSKRSLGE